MLPTWQGSNPQPPDHQSDMHPNEPPRLAALVVMDTTYAIVKVYVTECNDCIIKKSTIRNESVQEKESIMRVRGIHRKIHPL